MKIGLYLKTCHLEQKSSPLTPTVFCAPGTRIVYYSTSCYVSIGVVWNAETSDERRLTPERINPQQEESARCLGGSWGGSVC